MELNEVYKQAREKLKGYCRVCKICDGKACAGQVPGMGGANTGASFQANIEAWNDYKLRLKTLHGVNNPETKVNFLGLELSTPIIAAPITGTEINMGGALSEEEYTQLVVKGTQDYGTLAMTGDSGVPEWYKIGLEAIAEAEGIGIPIIKPRAQEEIMSRIRQAEESGALAVGVDIDGAGLITMALKGQPVGPKSFEELKELVASTELPFVLKGIMTPEEALMAAEAGVAAIVVSNHGGRVLDQTPGTARVLAKIVEAVSEEMTILVDGGIRTGVDVLKALALGADAVLVGRPLIISTFGAPEEGVELLLEELTTDLKKAMILTGSESAMKVSSDILE